MNSASGEFVKEAEKYTALQRYGKVTEIAEFVAYLAIPGASFITGASLAVTAATQSDCLSARIRCRKDNSI
jgi:3-oxoacyl-[acyl-carrier protein] reductase